MEGSEVMIKFLVKGQNIETLEHEVIAADQIAFVKIHFVFDNSWKPLHKVVQFTQDEFTYNRVLGFDETSCVLPAELAAGQVRYRAGFSGFCHAVLLAGPAAHDVFWH